MSRRASAADARRPNNQSHAYFFPTIACPIVSIKAGVIEQMLCKSPPSEVTN
jgi:hypothetical protein